jgi:hypothetical protein
MDAFSDPIAGAVWGFRFILWVSVLGLFWLVAAWIVADRKFGTYDEMEEEAKD